MKKETRSKMTTITTTPTVYKQIRKISYIIRVPVNEILNQFLVKFIDENQDALEEYDKMFPEKE